MSKYDYIMDIVKSKMSQGADYAKSIPGKLGVDGSSRFDRFARRHADTPISELENMSELDYLIDDVSNYVSENKKPLATGVGVGGLAYSLGDNDENIDLENLSDEELLQLLEFLENR